MKIYCGKCGKKKNILKMIKSNKYDLEIEFVNEPIDDLMLGEHKVSYRPISFMKIKYKCKCGCNNNIKFQQEFTFKLAKAIDKANEIRENKII